LLTGILIGRFSPPFGSCFRTWNPCPPGEHSFWRLAPDRPVIATLGHQKARDVPFPEDCRIALKLFKFLSYKKLRLSKG
jgi:hypothetical protein